MVRCPDCKATKFRFLYPTGSSEQRASDLVVCANCGADGPVAVPVSQIRD